MTSNLCPIFVLLPIKTILTLEKIGCRAATRIDVERATHDCQLAENSQ